MPHLKYAERYWRIASDELWLPGFCSLFGRLTWLIFLIIVISISADKLASCPSGPYILLYLIISILLLLITIINEGFIIRISIRGTMVENIQRDLILPIYLTIRIILALFQFLTAIFGCIIISAHSSIPCADTFEINSSMGVDTIFLCIVLFSQIIESSILACCMVIFASHSVHVGGSESNDMYDRGRDVWERRMKNLCSSIQICSCNLFGGSSDMGEHFQSVAEVLTMFFHHDGFLDIVPSDVVAGIILVRVQQKEREQMFKFRNKLLQRKSRSSDNVENSSTEGMSLELMESGALVNYEMQSIYSGSTDFTPVRPLDMSVDDDRMWLESVARFAPYSQAMYSHLLALFLQPVTGSCGLCLTSVRKNSSFCYKQNSATCKCSVCRCSCLKGFGDDREQRQRLILGDNCLRANETGVIHLIKGKNSAELKFASFQNNLNIKPYAIFYDSQKDSIILAVRGTLSLEDCITDANCASVELREAGQEFHFDGSGRYAHMGMLNAAIHIRREIDNLGILAKLMRQEHHTSKQTIDLTTPLVSTSYTTRSPSLTVVGHSLGGGTAILLTILLRPVFPHIQCISYGTPGSVLDSVSAVECRSFVTSVVLGYDIVCRLSFNTLVKLREQILECICRARVNKMVIMQAIFKEGVAASYMFKTGQEPPSALRISVRTFIDKINVRIRESDAVELVIPGRILHLKHMEDSSNPPYATLPMRSPTSYQLQQQLEPETIKSSSSTSKCCSLMKKAYIAVESTYENFKEIEVSSSMAYEHFPNQYVNAINDMYEEMMCCTSSHSTYNKNF